MTPDLPEGVRAALEDALSRGGSPIRIEGGRRVGGGCIHHALALDTTGGPVFLKWNRGDAGIGFEAEGRALSHLRRAVLEDDLLVVPKVMAARDAAQGEPGWLALEYLPPSTPDAAYHRRLGEGLGRLHAHGGDAFGWEEDNRIGPLHQPNPWREEWPVFWRDARLRPQLEAAYREGALPPGERGWSDPLLDAVEVALEPVAGDPPALLHGDLWSGNVHPGPDGRPVLVDPATYLGLGEVDLAMARLFGGFGPDTFIAYREIDPGAPGFEESRLPLYQLYYLLVHVRLFGASYLQGTRRAARAVLDAVG